MRKTIGFKSSETVINSVITNHPAKLNTEYGKASSLAFNALYLVVNLKQDT